jgi:hypothetical protein
VSLEDMIDDEYERRRQAQAQSDHEKPGPIAPKADAPDCLLNAMGRSLPADDHPATIASAFRL